MERKTCRFPARNGLTLTYDLTIDGDNAAVANCDFAVGTQTLTGESWSGAMADGDCVWMTPDGLVRVPATTDENGDPVQGDKPEARFGTGECYWLLARTSNTLLTLEVA